MAPPTSARPHSRARSACAAQCRATSDDEHAVSTVTAGPTSPRKYASRPDSTLAGSPVIAWLCTSAAEFASTDT